MTPTEKHRETARNLMDAACLPDPLVQNGTDKCLRIDIATALAKAEREGMRRAATKAADRAFEVVFDITGAPFARALHRQIVELSQIPD